MPEVKCRLLDAAEPTECNIQPTNGWRKPLYANHAQFSLKRLEVHKKIWQNQGPSSSIRDSST